jgi:hypothetical protein
MKEMRRCYSLRNRLGRARFCVGDRRYRRTVGWSKRSSQLAVNNRHVNRETYTAPTSGRTAEVHATRHLTLFTVLSTHGLGITVRCATLATVVRSIATDSLRATAAINSQLCYRFHRIIGYQLTCRQRKAPPCSRGDRHRASQENGARDQTCLG